MEYLNHHQLDPAIFDRLESIEWFSRCGGLPEQGFDLDVLWVADWSKAAERFSDPAWEAIRLEAQNALTEHLARLHPRQYQEWNKLVRAAKSKLVGVFEKARQFQQANGLSQKFVDCVKWDVLGIVTEETYKPCRSPGFSYSLLNVYERGRFPCGWEGEWPSGRLLVI